MRVAVLGLWHLGSVTAACAAAAGHDVVGFDPDARIVSGLAEGHPPIAEPRLTELVRRGLDEGRLHVTPVVADAVSRADLVWVCFDTPVDDDDRADVSFVLAQVESAFPALNDGAVVLVSSQVPVGSVRTLESAWQKVRGDRHVSFACSPENLRLGK